MVFYNMVTSIGSWSDYCENETVSFELSHKTHRRHGVKKNDRERQRETERDRERQRETERDRERQGETERKREKKSKRDKELDLPKA